MIFEDLRIAAEAHVALHGGREVAQLWTDLRLAQPKAVRTRAVVLTISDHFARLVIRSLRNTSTGAVLVPVIVMRGGVVFLRALWRELPSAPLGLVFPVRSEKPHGLDILYAEMPAVSSAHYVVFDLVVNSGDTMECVLQNIRTARQAGLPEPLTVQVAAPFSTAAAASRLRECFPGLVLHTMWNGLRRRANGWLTGLDFDAGDLAFGVERRVKAVSGKYLDMPSLPERSHSITKVAGLIRDGRRILVVRKNLPGRTAWILPGGKPEPGESQEETLRRELAEELDVQVSGIRWFGRFEDRATFEDVPMAMDVYNVEVHGTPRPSSEIVELRWIGQSNHEEGIVVGNLLKRGVLPALQRVNAL